MSGLDSQQRQAVEAPLCPLLVVAGAGTGKTRTLTHRVAYWIEQGLDPARTLLVTFTQRAAREMRDRISTLNDEPGLEWVGTFHSNAVRLLREYSSVFGYSPEFRVMDSNRSHALMKGVLGHANISEDTVSADALLKLHSLMVNADCSINDTRVRTSGLQRLDGEMIDALLVDYLVAKIEQDVMDYDDLLLYWHQLTMPDASTSQGVRDRFDAIFVDEYQDVNPLQVQLLDNLASTHRRLTVVGDDRQSIYGFRGSDVTAMLRFEERYPDARVIPITTNYRSTPEIVELSNRSIAHNRQRHHVPLSSARSSGPRPQVVTTASSQEQSRFIGQQILAHQSAGVPLHEQAILYRTHSQARALEICLGEAGIPYTLRSGKRLFERPHIRPVIDLVSALVHPENPYYWGAALTLFDGIGPVACEQTSTLIAEMGGITAWLAGQPWDMRISNRFRAPLERAHAQLSDCVQALSEEVSNGLKIMTEEIITPWVRAHYPDNWADRIVDLEGLVELGTRYHSAHEFLDGIILANDTSGKSDSVVLSTVHRAKGLEWAVVFIVGLFEGGFPLGASFGKNADLEEERRLFYVAMTRCQRWLYLCHAWQDHDEGHTQTPSRFLSEVSGSGINFVEPFSNSGVEQC